MKAFNFLFFCLFSCAKVYAQQDFSVSGVVIDQDLKLRIALAYVRNSRTQIVTGTNDMGIFRIGASIGDTLFVSKRNFNDLFVVVASNKDLVLHLGKGKTLREVVVIGQSKTQALNDLRKEFQQKGSFYEGKPPLKLLIPFGGSPLTFFYELLGKTPAKARRFKRLYDAEMQNTTVDHYFNKYSINKQTGLEGKLLEEFLVTYRPDYETAKTWTTYDAMKWINDAYKKFTDSAKSIK